jgi:hypothetical protein
VNFSCEPLAAYDAGEILCQDLQCNTASMSQVAREIHDRHSATAKLALDRITIVDDSGELV